MATVGYGDFTPATDLGRMLAVSQALLGQLYLVSVVAIIIGNLGRVRHPHTPGGEESVMLDDEDPAAAIEDALAKAQATASVDDRRGAAGAR